MPLRFRVDFEILNLDPPNNPTSHYGAYHFGYNLALITKIFLYIILSYMIYVSLQNSVPLMATRNYYLGMEQGNTGGNYRKDL